MAGEDIPSYADLQREVARLRCELAEARAELAESREAEAEGLARETATSDILRVIASSPTDLGAVLDAVGERAARLCECDNVSIFRVEGELLRKATDDGVPAGVGVGGTIPITLETASGRAVLDRRTIHLRDLLGEEGAGFALARSVQAGRVRSILATPLLREGAPIGAIVVRRSEVRPFTDQQIKLLETFADQAVIAIENTRLFTELQDRNQDLQESNRQVTEALEQQTATSEILRVIASSPADLQAVLDTVAENAARLCDANDGVVFRIDGDLLRRAAKYGPIPIPSSDEGLPINRRSVNGRAVLDRRTIHVHDLAAEPEAEYATGKAVQRRFGYHTVLATPLLREGVPLGTLSIRRMEVRPFSEQQIKLLETFADQAVIAIENTRLFSDLAESLEQQTATGEILRVIASSPAELQPVLDAVAESAARVCGANHALVWRKEGDMLRMASSYGSQPQLRPEMPVSRESVTGRAIVDRRTVHVRDLVAEEAEYPVGKAYQRQYGHRTVLATPLLREGTAVGALVIRRFEVQPFSPAQVRLLETFADQAVIAIENTRLFQDLNEALEQQTATAEVLRVIASSPTDLDSVLDSVVESAMRVCGAGDAHIFLCDGDALRLAAARGPLQLGPTSSRLLLNGQTVAGRSVVERRTVHVEDLAAVAASEYPEALPRGVRDGTRTLLATPLLREGTPLGAILLRRGEVRPFTEQQIALLETFADQAVIAIENTRLFQALQDRTRELEDKSAQLEVVSKHKSEFLANMSHELRTPLNAIIGFSEVLSEQMFGELNDKQLEYLGDILSSGQHLLSLINDILDLSKVEAGRMELELSQFSLPEALENGLTMLKERASRYGISLGLEIEPDLDDIEADERKVKQIVFNLLSNAVKFTPDGGRVDVTARLADGEVEVAVRDSGVGIAPEDLPHVFEEFRQVGQSAAKAEGTGLGLPLAKRFVELHGGRMWAESQVGVGSSFSFRLPQPPAGHASDAVQA